MQYVEFGSLKKQVSRFGMGCMRFPQMKAEDGSEQIDEAESIRMIRHAIDSGVNYFDTAYAYAGSEEVLGKALLDGYREKVTIVTKVPLWAVKSHEDYQRVFDEQLKRLQVEDIDIYIFHCLDREGWEIVKSTDGIAFMEGLKFKGKIKQIGFSFHAEYELFTEIIDAYNWDMCMIQLNVIDQNHQAGVKGLKYAAEKGIPVAIMEPLKGGLLANYITDEVKTLLGNYPEKRTLVDWAFRWLYDQPEAAVIVSGASSMEQLEDSLRIFEGARPGVMSARDKELMNQVKDIYNSKVRVGCTGCGYCMPCPAGVNIPEIFKVYNDEAIHPWPLFGKTFYSLVASHSGRDASNCVECRKCESHCPQKISIPEVLMKAHALMKA